MVTRLMHRNKMAANTDHESHNHVKVLVRTRPTPKFAKDMIIIDEDHETIDVKLHGNTSTQEEVVANSKKNPEWSFKFDEVFYQSSQERVYSAGVSPFIMKAFDGYSSCIMAYGQVGSGKSYTMIGPENDFTMRGAIPRAITEVFQEMSKREKESTSNIKVSYVEVYNDRLIDLLSELPDEESPRTSNAPSFSESGAENELTVKTVESEEEALNLLFEGEFHRKVSYHPLNTLSSRSHVIFTLHIETSSKSLSNAEVMLSKVHLIDLGGMERLNKSLIYPNVRTEFEAKYINKSLSFLEQVVLSIASSHRRSTHHIPYRQSKLTYYLSDTLQTASQIVLIANIRGEPEFIEETISTLKFVARMKGLPTVPTSSKILNEEKLATKRQREIDLLKQELKMQDMLHCGGTTTFEALNEVQINKIQKQVKEFVEGNIPEIKISTVRQTKEAFNQLKSHISATEKSREQETEELKSKVDSLEAKLQALQTDQIEVAKSTSKGSVKKSVSSNKSEEPREVGTDDGQSISVGRAPTNMKGAMKTSPRKFSIGRVSISDAQKKKGSKAGQSDDSGLDGDGTTISNRASLSMRPSTPPPREEAFETFKNGRGKELHAVFIQNKAILAKKQKDITVVKKRLQEMNDKLIELQKEMDSNKDANNAIDGSIMTTDGRLVLREHEYTNLIKLKQMRTEYKLCLASLEASRAELPLCLEHVLHSRKRLLKEFESWFKCAYIGGDYMIGIDTSISSGSRLYHLSSSRNKMIANSRDDVDQQGLSRVKESVVLSSTAYRKANQRAMKRAKAWKLPEKKSFLATV